MANQICQGKVVRTKNSKSGDAQPPDQTFELWNPMVDEFMELRSVDQRFLRLQICDMFGQAAWIIILKTPKKKDLLLLTTYIAVPFFTIGRCIEIR